MSVTGLDAFDTTVQKTNIWLDQIMTELGTMDRHQAYHALRVVLHALRDRLTVEETVQLGAQLPMLVRGFYYEGWNPAGKPGKAHREEFLDTIRAGFRPRENVDPEHIARAVFKVVAAHISEGEIRDVKNILPKDLRALWPHPWWD